MHRNGMCPVCFIKKLLTAPRRVSETFYKPAYDNNAALTPPMGWSSWNTFRNNIDDVLLIQTAEAMRDKGLIEAGYRFINLDDCWHSSMRDKDGNLQGDLTRFPEGIPSLVKKLNDIGLKVGIYSSNGTYTCEDLPASLGHERGDALTFARWGIEFFKYDFCHNVRLSSYAPLVYAISVAPAGGKDIQTVTCEDALLYGTAKLMPCRKLTGGQYISGLDGASGKAVFKNIYAPEEGEYTLTIHILKKGLYDKFLIAHVNEGEFYRYDIPSQMPFNTTARFQQRVVLKKGLNTVSFFNPVRNRADSAMIQYLYMGKMLKEASAQVAAETGKPEKPITYSICEWGRNQPWKWGRSAGNMWRTTPDIRPWWVWIKIIYDKTVNLYPYAGKGAWNDPDMLEVGNGNLTPAQNRSHFSLWCMMCAPLVLGNDIRKMNDQVLEIVTNREMIAINQDELGKPAKRVRKSGVDILAKPLSGNRVAVCFFNKGSIAKKSCIKLSQLVKDGYVRMPAATSYTAREAWSGEELTVSDSLRCKVEKDSVKVYILTPVAK